MKPHATSRRKARRNAGLQLAAAGAAVGVLVVLARRAARAEPTPFDRRARAFVMRHRRPALTTILAPFDPLGYPGGYIPVAYLCARWLRRRGVTEHRALLLSAWAALIAHRLAKLVYERKRPPRGLRVKGPKPDSFPSGHTTGATAFAITLARVLADNELLSRREAAAFGAAVPLVMGGSRVYSDVHWATDVAGGWLLGAAVAFSLGALLDLQRSRKRGR